MSGALLEVRSVAKSFGPVRAVADVSFEVARGEVFALLGGSGCGKTTLLRMLAGFERPDRGQILLDGADLADSPPHRRPINLMFQNHALFPHLSVRDNVAYGLRREGVAGAELARRTEEALALVRLEGLDARKPAQLSGGQRQRVALARALVKRPKLLLLDEPLSALDARLREETRAELLRLQRELGLAFLIVTHDQQEAMSMADRLAVMHDGGFMQVGTPRDVYARPATRHVAIFLGNANLLPAPADAAGRPGWLVLRPERIAISRVATGAGAVGAHIEDVAFEGDRTLLVARTDAGVALRIASAEPGWARGEPVFLAWDAAALHRVSA